MVGSLLQTEFVETGVDLTKGTVENCDSGNDWNLTLVAVVFGLLPCFSETEALTGLDFEIVTGSLVQFSLVEPGLKNFAGLEGCSGLMAVVD